MGEICTDNRFEIIEKVKVDLLTNNTISQDELEVLDGILFSLWQRGYFRLNEQIEQLKEKIKILEAKNFEKCPFRYSDIGCDYCDWKDRDLKYEVEECQKL